MTEESSTELVSPARGDAVRPEPGEGAIKPLAHVHHGLLQAMSLEAYADRVLLADGPTDPAESTRSATWVIPAVRRLRSIVSPPTAGPEAPPVTPAPVTNEAAAFSMKGEHQ